MKLKKKPASGSTSIVATTLAQSLSSAIPSPSASFRRRQQRDTAFANKRASFLARDEAVSLPADQQLSNGIHTGITDQVRVWKAQGKTVEEVRTELKNKSFHKTRISQFCRRG